MHDALSPVSLWDYQSDNPELSSDWEFPATSSLLHCSMLWLHLQMLKESLLPPPPWYGTALVMMRGSVDLKLLSPRVWRHLMDWMWMHGSTAWYMLPPLRQMHMIVNFMSRCGNLFVACPPCDVVLILQFVSTHLDLFAMLIILHCYYFFVYTTKQMCTIFFGYPVLVIHDMRVTIVVTWFLCILYCIWGNIIILIPRPMAVASGSCGCTA